MPRGRPKHDDEPIARLVAAGGSPSDVASAVGVSVNTVYARLRDPMFRARVQELRGLQLRPLEKTATQAAGELLAVIHDIALDWEIDPKARTAAATKGIELMLKLREETLVFPRLAALEAALAMNEPASPMATDEAPEPQE